jgi:transposase-like protein
MIYVYTINPSLMNIIGIYKRFPTQESCLEYLMQIRWNGTPSCPYCKSTRSSKLKSRFHCNNCNASYSVLVGTIFKGTKLELQKWFLAVSLILNGKKGYSARQLARDIEINPNTAWLMLMKIRVAMKQDTDLLEGIVEADETYVGGRRRNKHSDKKGAYGDGRGVNTKAPVLGVVQRGGQVRAIMTHSIGGKQIHKFIKDRVKKGSTLYTDEYGSYKSLRHLYTHGSVNHSIRQYVEGDKHTNTLEGFWGMLKRGINGSYHSVTRKYLQKYIDEFCFRYNNRGNKNLFEMLIKKTIIHETHTTLKYAH